MVMNRIDTAVLVDVAKTFSFSIHPRHLHATKGACMINNLLHSVECSAAYICYSSPY